MCPRYFLRSSKARARHRALCSVLMYGVLSTSTLYMYVCALRDENSNC